MNKREQKYSIFKAKVRKERLTGVSENSLSFAINNGFSTNKIKELLGTLRK